MTIRRPTLSVESLLVSVVENEIELEYRIPSDMTVGGLVRVIRAEVGGGEDEFQLSTEGGNLLDVETAEILAFKSVLEAHLRDPGAAVRLQLHRKVRMSARGPRTGGRTRLAPSVQLLRHDGFTLERIPGSFPLCVRLPHGGSAWLLVPERATVPDVGRQLRTFGAAAVEAVDSMGFALVDPLNGLALREADVVAETPHVRQFIRHAIIPTLETGAEVLDVAPLRNSADDSDSDEDEPAPEPTPKELRAMARFSTVASRASGSARIHSKSAGPGDRLSIGSRSNSDAPVPESKDLLNDVYVLDDENVLDDNNVLRMVVVQLTEGAPETVEIEVEKGATVGSVRDMAAERFSRDGIRLELGDGDELGLWGTDLVLCDRRKTLDSVGVIVHLWRWGLAARLYLRGPLGPPTSLEPQHAWAKGKELAFSTSPYALSEAAAFRQAVEASLPKVYGGREWTAGELCATNAARGEQYGDDFSFLLRVYVPSHDAAMAPSKTVHCKKHDTVRSVAQRIVRKLAPNEPQPDPEHAYMRQCGQRRFARNDARIVDLVCVQESLAKGAAVQLALVEPRGVRLDDVADNALPVSPVESYLEEDGAMWRATVGRFIDARVVRQPFEVRVRRALRLPRAVGGVVLNPAGVLFVEAVVCIGGDPMGGAATSNAVSAVADAVHWDEWARFEPHVADLPPSVRLCVTLMYRDAARVVAVGGASLPLFDSSGVLCAGVRVLRLWPDTRADPGGLCGDNAHDATATAVVLDFRRYSLPVVCTSSPIPDLQRRAAARGDSPPPPPVVAERLERLARADPLHRHSPEEQRLLWTHAEHLRRTDAAALPAVVAAAPVASARARTRLHALLLRWPMPPTTVAMQLLSARFADPRVRAFAVDALRGMDDDDMAQRLLQLVQALKFEPHIGSALAHFLLARALRNRSRVGHVLFWHLCAQMQTAGVSDRHGLLLQTYLRACGGQGSELMRQYRAVHSLNAVARGVKTVPSAKRRSTLAGLLAKCDVGSFDHPLDPCIRLGSLVVDKCKCMDSAKAPLWLVFLNEDALGGHVYVIFKSGDDLRQDQITLQLLRRMDALWRSHGLDLALTPYRCISTGEGMGMIEVVLNACTSADIQKAAGGVTAAFKSTPLANWLRDHNRSDDAYARAVDVFTRSCAGYCVATFVLGIGDRHNDNIMVHQDGRLLHIDFGHFLGNYKKFLGMDREKAPFVLTPEFAHVIGGEKSARFAEFTKLCSRLYVILRRYAPEFITLFMLMLSTGIPELRSEEDIAYLRRSFSLDLGDDDAECEAHFARLVSQSLNTKRTQVNFMFHLMRHPN